MKRWFALPVMMICLSASVLAADPVRVFFTQEESTLQSPDGARRVEMLLRNSGFSVSRVNESGLRGMTGIEGFTEKGVIVMPGVDRIAQPTVERLAQFVRDGGRLLFLDAPTTSIAQSAAVREMIGCSAATQTWSGNNVTVSFDKHFVSPPKALTLAETAGASLELTTGKVLGRFTAPAAGAPAVVLNRYGQGRALTLNWDAAKPTHPETDALIVRCVAWLAADGNDAEAAGLLRAASGEAAKPSRLAPPSSMARLAAVGAAAPEPPADYSKPTGMRKGTYFEVSNFCDIAQVGKQPLKEMPAFKNMIKIVKAAGINTLCVTPRYKTQAIYPSKYLQHMDYDLLKEFCDGAHEEKLNAEVFMVERDPYFGNFKGYRNQIQCIWDFKDKWANVVRELAGHDLDGMCVPPDEYWHNAHRGVPPADDPCTAKFREWYGMEPPAQIGDDAVSRAWIQYNYRALGEVYASWNELAKKINPKMARMNILYVGSICYNKRQNISFDVIGHATDFDYIMTDPYVGLHVGLRDHYYVPEVVKHLEGASPIRKSMVCLQGARLRAYQPVLRPIYVYGEALSSLAGGGDGVYFYYYGVYANPDGTPKPAEFHNIETAFNAMRTLERWGLKDASVPTQIALLHNQRGQDYAELRKGGDMGNGHEAHEKGNDLLLANGYPYQLYYLEQEADWKEIPGLQVIVLPFAYAVSDSAVAQLEHHLKAGRRLVIMQRMGEADEKGEMRPTPALERLAQAYPKQVYRIPGEVFAGFSDENYVKRFNETMAKALGKDRLLTLHRYGHDVEVSALELPGGRLLVFALNWEPGDVSFELGLNLPQGSYRLMERNPKGAQPVTLKGRDTIKAGDLKQFAVDLKQDEFKVWLVEPVQAAAH